jgi:HlyD family secretion protein
MARLGSAAATAGAALLTLTASTGPAAPEAPKDIGATGTIEPRGGVVLVSGVPGAIIKSINAHIGQTVKQGDVLMVLDDRDARADTNLNAIALAETRRHRAQATTDEGQAVVLAERRAREAADDATAYHGLGPNATSQHQLVAVDSAAQQARVALAIERRKYAQIQADSASDVASAAKRYNLSRARLAAYQVTAPADGVVLQIDQHVGEVLGGAPPVQMGDLSEMYVTCDAFQGDLLKITPGMHATVSSNALGSDLTGRVEWVGRLIQTKAQTGQFKVKLDDPALASRLVGMEVNVKVAR